MRKFRSKSVRMRAKSREARYFWRYARIMPRDVFVHLVPQLVEPGRLQGGIAVVIDVLRATTTIVHALAAGCLCVRPCVEIADAHALAATLPAGSVLLGGERGGRPIPGFDLGNSPAEYTAAR